MDTRNISLPTAEEVALLLGGRGAGGGVDGGGTNPIAPGATINDPPLGDQAKGEQQPGQNNNGTPPDTNQANDRTQGAINYEDDVATVLTTNQQHVDMEDNHSEDADGNDLLNKEGYEGEYGDKFDGEDEYELDLNLHHSQK